MKIEISFNIMLLNLLLLLHGLLVASCFSYKYLGGIFQSSIGEGDDIEINFTLGLPSPCPSNGTSTVVLNDIFGKDTGMASLICRGSLLPNDEPPLAIGRIVVPTTQSKFIWDNVDTSGKGWIFHLSVKSTTLNSMKIINHSPMAGYIPLISMNKNCPFNGGNPWALPVYDPDGDKVLCRFSKLDECGPVCKFLPELQSKNFSALRLVGNDGCMLLAEPNIPGLYGVAIQLEDFADILPGEPMSSVPLRFFIEVRDDGLTNCQIRPGFVKPTVPHMACLGAHSNVTFTRRLFMTAGMKEDSVIVKILNSFPFDVEMTQPQAIGDNYFTDFVWKSPLPGVHHSCFTPVNNFNVNGDTHCIAICVGARIPKALSMLPYFREGNFKVPVHNIRINFDSVVQAGLMGAKFRILERRAGEMVFIKIFETSANHFMYFNTFSLDIDLRSIQWRQDSLYRFEIEDGIAVSPNCCGVFADLSLVEESFSRDYQDDGKVIIPMINQLAAPVRQIASAISSPSDAAPILETTMIAVPALSTATTASTTTTMAMTVETVTFTPPTTTTKIVPLYSNTTGKCLNDECVTQHSSQSLNNLEQRLTIEILEQPVSSEALRPIFLLHPLVQTSLYPDFNVKFVNFPLLAVYDKLQIPFKVASKGVISEALSLNGYNQFISIHPKQCPDCLSNTPVCDSGISICLWFKPLAQSGNDQYIFSGFADSLNLLPHLSLVQTAFEGLQVALSNGSMTLALLNSGTGTMTPGKWFFICLQYRQATGMALYVDGLLVANRNASSIPILGISSNSLVSECSFFIGKPNFQSTEEFNGRFAFERFQIWLSLIPPGYIKEMFLLGKPVFYWTASCPPLSREGEIVETVSFVTGYNGDSLKCTSRGNGVIWRSIFSALGYAAYTTVDSYTVSFQVKIEISESDGSVNIPIFAIELSGAKIPKLAISYSKLKGFQVLYKSLGRYWFIDRTVEFFTNYQWHNVILKASPNSGVHLFIDGILTGTGIDVGQLPDFGFGGPVNVVGLSDPMAGISNIILCSPSNKEWFTKVNEAHLLLIDDIEIWLASLPNSLISKHFAQTNFGYLSFPGRVLLLPTTHGVMKLPISIIGNPVETSTDVGPGVYFRANDHLSAALSPDLCYFSPAFCTDGFTVCLQLKVDAITTNSPIISNLAGPNSDGMHLQINSNKTLTVYFRFGLSTWLATTPDLIKIGVFNVICFSWSVLAGIHITLNGICSAIAPSPLQVTGFNKFKQASTSNSVLIIGKGPFNPLGNNGTANNMEYILVDLKLWNAKYFPADLYPYPMSATMEQKVRSADRSVSKQQSRNSTDLNLESSEKWLLAVMVPLASFLIFSSLAFLFTSKYASAKVSPEVQSSQTSTFICHNKLGLKKSKYSNKASSVVQNNSTRSMVMAVSFRSNCYTLNLQQTEDKR